MDQSRQKFAALTTLIHGSDCLGRNLRIAIGVKVDDLWVGRPAFCAITH